MPNLQNLRNLRETKDRITGFSQIWQIKQILQINNFQALFYIRIPPEGRARNRAGARMIPAPALFPALFRIIPAPALFLALIYFTSKSTTTFSVFGWLWQVRI